MLFAVQWEDLMHRFDTGTNQVVEPTKYMCRIEDANQVEEPIKYIDRINSCANQAEESIKDIGIIEDDNKVEELMKYIDRIDSGANQVEEPIKITDANDIGSTNEPEHIEHANYKKRDRRKRTGVPYF